MLLFLTTLFSSKTARTGLTYAMLVVALLIGLRWYSNKAYSDGRSEGVKAALSESISVSENSWRSDLAALQKQMADARNDSHVAAEKAVLALHKASTVQAATATAIGEISNAVQAIPAAELPARLVANDPSIQTQDVADVNRHLLESQMINKELLDKVKALDADWREYKAATDSQIASLNDQLTATQGQLHVMTQERDAYKASFESATKKRGCGALKKVLTLGICR